MIYISELYLFVCSSKQLDIVPEYDSLQQSCNLAVASSLHCGGLTAIMTVYVWCVGV